MRPHAVKAVEVEPADYHEAAEEYLGWCSSCLDFTNSGVEPDAEGYICEECGDSSVYGTEQAMLAGLITFAE